MGFAVTSLSSLPHSLWIIDSLQFCEFSLIVFHFPAPPHPIAMWTNSLNCPKKSNLCNAQLQLQLHIYSYIYSCRYICICEIRRTLRGHSPSAAAIRLMSSSTTGDGQQKRRQLLDQAKCPLSPSASDPSPWCFCVCVYVATKQKNLSTFQHIGRGKTNTASILSRAVSLFRSLSLSRKLPINNFRHNFQLENSAKMFNEYKIEIELNEIVFWFDFRLKMTKFADIDDDLRAKDVVENERQIEIQLSITWPHSPHLLYPSLPNFFSFFSYLSPAFPLTGLLLLPPLFIGFLFFPYFPFPLYPQIYLFILYFLFSFTCFWLSDEQSYRIVSYLFQFQLQILHSNLRFGFSCGITWGDQLLPLYSFQLHLGQPGQRGKPGRQAPENLSSYSHTRRGTHTYTHTCTGTHSGAQRGVCFCFSENRLRYFPKFFLCFCFFALLFFLLFFLCFSFWFMPLGAAQQTRPNASACDECLLGNRNEKPNWKWKFEWGSSSSSSEMSER